MADIEEKKIEPRYARDAKDLVNLMFDKGFIAADCNRESMDVLENFIGYLFQANVESAMRGHELVKRLREMKKV